MKPKWSHMKDQSNYFYLISLYCMCNITFFSFLAGQLQILKATTLQKVQTQLIRPQQITTRRLRKSHPLHPKEMESESGRSEKLPLALWSLKLVTMGLLERGNGARVSSFPPKSQHW